MNNTLSSDESSDEEAVMRNFDAEARLIINTETLPKKSVDRYNLVYESYKKWQREHQTSLSNSEETNLIVYFKDLTKKLKPSTIWSVWSILKKMLNTRDNININNFLNLKALVKNNSKGYRPKKSSVLKWDEILKFIKDAPDHDHLASKRGSDELLSQSGAVNNGASMSPQPHHAADNNNDAKKAKLDKSHNGKPSKVVHIRNIASDVTESEIIHLGMPFGRVTNVLVLKGKNQAFLEMADESSATTMVGYYAATGANLRGRAVYVQFSNHRELKTDQAHSNAVSSPTTNIIANVNNTNTQVALQAAQGQNVQSQGDTQGGPNTVLRVIVEHMIYPISLDILYQIFTRFGKVLKIVTFTKNSTFQALIQYSDTMSAQTAKLSLDGQNIYNSCCTLRIDFSKMQSLNVKYNNDKSRDYTNPNLPTGDPNLDAASLALGGELLPQLLLGAAGSQPRARLPGAPSVLASPFAAMHGLPSPLAGPYGNGVAPGGGIAGLGGFSLGAGALGVRVPGNPQISSVLLVTNLNEEMVTPDALFTLFGVYGDVQRVKILYNKKDSALIQMAEPHQGHLAMTHMDKLRVFGKQIRVMVSKHQTVQLPKEGQPDAGLTKDYTNSPLHRFKKPGSKNYQNIYPPSATLHLSNIPATVTEEEIKDAFTQNGFTVKAFKFFPKDRKMALIQMPSMDEAVAALIKMHNYQLSESNHLRVSFSKSNI